MTNLKRLLLAIAALSLVASVPASARNCTQTCTPTYGGGSVCNTYCY